MSPKAIYPVLETHKSEKNNNSSSSSRVALSLIEFGIIILSPLSSLLLFKYKKEEVKCDAPELLYCIEVSTPQLFYGHVDEVK